MKFDTDLYCSALKAIATMSSGCFVGASLYINLVESPARMTHDAGSAITMWKPSFVRAKSFNSKLALLSGLSSVGVYWSLRKSSQLESMFWLNAGCGMLSLFPVTMIFLSPINSQLVETEKCISVKGDEWIVKNLKQWSRMHSIRTVISLGAFSLMTYALLKK